MSSLCPLTECGHPIIDVEKLKRGSDAEASALGAALGDYGYFYAANVEGLSAEYIRSLYAYSGRCHALPAAVKHKYRQRGGTKSQAESSSKSTSYWRRPCARRSTGSNILLYSKPCRTKACQNVTSNSLTYFTGTNKASSMHLTHSLSPAECVKEMS